MQMDKAPSLSNRPSYIAKGHISAPALPPCHKGRGQLPPLSPGLRHPCQYIPVFSFHKW